MIQFPAEYIAKLRRAAKTQDAPIVVTAMICPNGEHTEVEITLAATSSEYMESTFAALGAAVHAIHSKKHAA